MARLTQRPALVLAVLAGIALAGPGLAQTDRAVTPVEVTVYSGNGRATVALDELQGARVYDSTGDWVGEVQVVRVTRRGLIDRATLQIGGFLGFGTTEVTLDGKELDVVDRAGAAVVVYVPMTEAELLARAAGQG